MEITDQSFNIVDIKPANMEELTEVGHWREWGDFTEYIPLVPGEHRKKITVLYVLPKMTKCYERYMEKVTRKHTRQAPRQIIGPLGLWSPQAGPPGTPNFFSSFFCFKTGQKST